MELFKLIGKVFIENDEANKDIDETTGKAEKSESKISGSLKKIGKVAASIAMAGVVAMSTVATGIAAITQSAIQYYADYEQLVGGVETLFKNSSGKVVEYANNAYKTAGLSANEYMETVTSFSASLLQSLDGDTAKAAEKANIAITDMSDNANKMGSGMESIQNAYQGFAKQNYTMLDNLKLGYGGTKEEMQRLLIDAEKISGIKYDLSSYSDLVDAIHVIQTEMGITGTTAKEAATTIQGSIGMMKAAWVNFLTGMADPKQDFDALLGNLVSSIVTVADNLIPRIAATLPRLVQGLMGIATTLGTYLPGILQKLLPSLLTGAAQLLSQLVTGIPELFRQLMPTLIDAVKQILSSAFGAAGIDTASPLIQSISSSFINLYQSIRNAVENHILPCCKSFIDMLKNLWEENKDKLAQIAELFSIIGIAIMGVISWVTDFINENMGTIQAMFQATFDIIGGIVSLFIALFKGDWSGCWDAIVQIIKGAVDLVMNYFTLLGNFFSSIGSIILNLIISAFTNIKNYMIQLVMDAINWVIEKFNSLPAPIQNVLSIILGIIYLTVTSVITKLQQAHDFIINVFNLILSFLQSIGSTIWSVVQNTFEDVRLAIVNKLNQAKDSVISIFTAIKDAINEKIQEAKNIVTAGVQVLKDLFNFEWKLPQIKLPHFSISGSFSLDPPSIPSFGVEWYKNGGVMMRPTAFGINPMNGKMMAGGEAGAEAIAPISVLQKYVSDAVAGQNVEIVAVLNLILKAIYTMDEGLGQKIYQAMLGMRFEINNREFGRLVRAVN